jgi:predicted CxxxxCH...CXXCH cytochrome family protein
MSSHRATLQLARMLALVASLAACTQARERKMPRPVYEGDVEDLLDSQCARCHGRDDDAGAGYHVDDYADVLRCPRDAPTRPAADDDDGGAPLLDVLKQPDHAHLLDRDETARLRTWVGAAAPLRDHGVHAPGILNPRSPDWHGRLATKRHDGPITDPKDPQVCGRCHAGAPVTPHGVHLPAADAPPCTQCHREPEGVLACSTCHGDGAARAYPPRDRCAFASPAHDAHRAHLQPSALRDGMLLCTNCHPRADATLSGTHADGHVDIRFDPTLAGADAAFDAQTHTCTVGCHDHGGKRSRPRWYSAGPMRCGDCHGAPPANHYAGACNDCHTDVNGKGTAVTDTGVHMNGRIDIKGGLDHCTGCHGSGDDPMPQTPAHLLHRKPLFTTPIDCVECHVVPKHVTDPGHLDIGTKTPADVNFGPRASARNRHPTYENGTCRDVACHGAGLVDGIERALRWDDRPVQRCSGCHGLPPAAPHPQDGNCASVICHGSEVGESSIGPTITAAGLAKHIDGTIDFAGR